MGAPMNVSAQYLHVTADLTSREGFARYGDWRQNLYWQKTIFGVVKIGKNKTSICAVNSQAASWAPSWHTCNPAIAPISFQYPPEIYRIISLEVSSLSIKLGSRSFLREYVGVP